MNRKDHWERVYEERSDAEVSWTQGEPLLSLSLIAEASPPPSRVIDVGGGTSGLGERLLHAGYTVTVLDISEAALAKTRERLGEKGKRIRWIVADITDASDLGQYDLWHDRAVFHFLTEEADRKAYLALLLQSVPSNGHAIIATFAPEGPEKCSGLVVQRYDAGALSAELGPGFELLRSIPEAHMTPWGQIQPFQYALFRRA